MGFGKETALTVSSHSVIADRAPLKALASSEEDEDIKSVSALARSLVDAASTQNRTREAYGHAMDHLHVSFYLRKSLINDSSFMYSQTGVNVAGLMVAPEIATKQKL